MADLEFQRNSTQEMEEQEGLLSLIMVFMYLCALLLSIGSIIFGLVSWAVLPKWRQFRHYVFLSLLLTTVLNWIIAPITETWPITEDFLTLYVIMTFTYWLMIITVMFFIEFVQVFTSLNTIQHVYLYANIFGWILPLVTVTLCMFCGDFILNLTTLILTIVNFALYLRVLIVLCRPSNFPGSRTRVGKNIILLTFTFTVTGLFIFIPLFILGALEIDITLSILFYVITILLVNLFFLMLKSHRVLWTEHRQRAKNSRI